MTGHFKWFHFYDCLTVQNIHIFQLSGSTSLYKYISVRASLSICHVWFIWNMRSWIALKFFRTLFWIKCCGHLPPFGSGVNWFREVVAPYLYIISPSCSMLFYCVYWSIIKLSNNHFLQAYYYQSFSMSGFTLKYSYKFSLLIVILLKTVFKGNLRDLLCI